MRRGQDVLTPSHHQQAPGAGLSPCPGSSAAPCSAGLPSLALENQPGISLPHVLSRVEPAVRPVTSTHDEAVDQVNRATKCLNSLPCCGRPPKEATVSTPEPDRSEYEYDLAVSYAGEDRAFVEDVVRRVQASGARVFFDQDQLARMWGENLVDFLQSIYARKARYAILFISRDYIVKKWTGHERQAAQDRALQQASPYVLPVKLDSSELPGLHSTIAYIDARQVGVERLAELVAEKLGVDAPVERASLPDRVPQTAHEVGLLLEQRPRAWEYLLWVSALQSGIDALEDNYRDFELEYAPTSGTLVNDADGIAFIRSRIAMMRAASASIEKLLTPAVQDGAFGAPGEPGDPDRILHLAKRVVGVYEDLLGLAAELRAMHSHDDDLHAVADALAHFVDQPVAAIRRVVVDLATALDGVGERLQKGEHIALTPALTFEIPEEVQRRFDDAFDVYKRAHGLHD
jgi:TIR domain